MAEAIFHNWHRFPGDLFWSIAEALGGSASQLVVGRNADGRMEVFYVGTDDLTYHNWQGVPNGPFQGSVALGGSAKQVTVGTNADGRMEVFYVSTDDLIYHNWQGVPNGPFQGPVALGGSAKQVTVGTNADGRMEVVYIGTDDLVYHNWQDVPNGPFQGQVALGGSAKQVIVGTNADGRMEVFYTGTDDRIYHNWQGVPNGPFQGEVALGGSAKQVTVGRNADGRMEVFYIGTDDLIYHNWQGVPNGPFQGEAPLGGNAKQVIVRKDAHGLMQLFHVGMDDRLYMRYQSAQNAPFYGAGPFLFLGTVGRILDIGTNQDGRLEIFYQGELAPKGPIVVRGLAPNDVFIIPNQIEIDVETSVPVGADTLVKVSSVRNPDFTHSCPWWEEPSVVSVLGSGEAVIPAGGTKTGFTLVAAKAGYAWIKVEADGYIQVEDVSPQWTIPDLQMVNVLSTTPVAVKPAQHEMDQGDSFGLTVTMATPPWKDTPVQLLLATNSPLQGRLALQPSEVVIGAGRTSTQVIVTAVAKGPASDDLWVSARFNSGGSACHITVKGLPTPQPPPPPVSVLKTYMLALKWQAPYQGKMYVKALTMPVPNGVLQKVRNATTYPWRYRLWFPNQPGATTDDAFDPKKGYLLDVGRDATPAQLGLPTNMSAGIVVVAVPSSVDQPTQGPVYVELAYTAP